MAAVRARRQGCVAVVARAAIATIGAIYACRALAFLTAQRSSPGREARGLVQGLESRPTPRAAVHRMSSAEEEGLTSAVKNGNKDRVLRAIEAMPAAPKDAFKQLEGQWKVSWDSNAMGPTVKKVLKFQCEQLPPVLVEFYFQYNEIKDGTYRWFQAFTMPGFERTNAALMMSGPIKKGKKGSTATVELNSVQLVPTSAGTGESKEAMRSLGLDRCMKPQKLKGDGPMEIEIRYISDETQVQIDEVGSKYVMTKLSESYPIPYVYEKSVSAAAY